MTTTAPQWAQDLVLKVLEDEHCDKVPILTWSRAKSKVFSSGVCYENRIHVSAGSYYPQVGWHDKSGRSHWISNRKDQATVLLHELAHWVIGGDEHHSDKFWDKAWELFRRYKPAPVAYIKAREGSYRKGALTAYRRSK